MTTVRQLARDERGTALMQFALSAPVLVTLLWGIFELACLFWANAGIQSALGAGARYATLCIDGSFHSECEVPTDDEITAKMNAALFGPPDGEYEVSEPATAPGESGYKTLTVTYTRDMNFLFFPGPTVTLTRTKKVYTVVDDA